MNEKIKKIMSSECEELREIKTASSNFNLKKMIIGNVVVAFLIGLIAASSAEDYLYGVNICGYIFGANSDSFLGGFISVWIAVFVIVFLVITFIDIILMAIVGSHELKAKNLDCNIKIMKLLVMLAGDEGDSLDSSYIGEKREGFWKCSNCGRENARYVGTCACGTQRDS